MVNYDVNIIFFHYLQGDSGGPLMCKSIYTDRQSKWFLLGVFNWVTDGCAYGFPDGFARVSYFNEWISNTIDNNGGPN